MSTYLEAELQATLRPGCLFEDTAALQGETYRQVKSRRTFRFRVGDRAYFAKVHFGVGWAEIFKNLLQLRWPVLSAENEWLAIRRLQALGIDTMTPVGYEKLGWNPAHLRSCIVTRALENTTSLEDLVLMKEFDLARKRNLLPRIGCIARTMHEAGINHRDFYICHFLLNRSTDRLYLIDLHRAQLRSGVTPERWRAKDIAGLLFSAADAGLTRRDLYRFVKVYFDQPLIAALRQHRGFLHQVVQRAHVLYRKDHGRPSALLVSLLRDLE